MVDHREEESNGQMLGVVLWSDSDDNKAVIWCEDHGNLAFYNGGSHPSLDVFDFDAGDLVQFELTEEQHMRYARNPKRVSQSSHPSLVEDLQNMTLGQEDQIGGKRPKPVFKTAEVIPFRKKAISSPRGEPAMA